LANAGLNDGNAAIPDVNIGTTWVSDRPEAVFSAAHGNLPEPDIRAGAAEMYTEGLIPILQAAELVSPTWFT
jgi:hypothetical protein